MRELLFVLALVAASWAVLVVVPAVSIYVTLAGRI